MTGGFTGDVHPLAAKYAMLPDDEMDALASTIAEDGLERDLTLDWLGRLVDGRNRLEACRRVGVEPRFFTHPRLTDEKSVARYVRKMNNTRRNHSTGQHVASEAICLAAEGKRRNGRWVRGSISTSESGTISAQRMAEAGFILDWGPGLLERVLVGELAFEAAYQSAKAVEDAAKADERAMAVESADNRAKIDKADDDEQAAAAADVLALRPFADYASFDKHRKGQGDEVAS